MSPLPAVNDRRLERMVVGSFLVAVAATIAIGYVLGTALVLFVAVPAAVAGFAYGSYGTWLVVARKAKELHL